MSRGGGGWRVGGEKGTDEVGDAGREAAATAGRHCRA